MLQSVTYVTPSLVVLGVDKKVVVYVSPSVVIVSVISFVKVIVVVGSSLLLEPVIVAAPLGVTVDVPVVLTVDSRDSTLLVAAEVFVFVVSSVEVP